METTINRERLEAVLTKILGAPSAATPEQRAQVEAAAETLRAQPDWYIDAMSDHYGSWPTAVQSELRATLAGQMSPIPGRLLRSYRETAERIEAARQ